MERNIISFNVLYCDGFAFGFDNNNGSILVYKNDALYFKANQCNDIYETIIGLRKNDSLILIFGSSKDDSDKSCLRHCRLSHIKRKRITKI